jgi:hypothetical protein
MYYSEAALNGTKKGGAKVAGAPAARAHQLAFLVGDGMSPENRQTLVVFGGHRRSSRFDDTRVLNMKTMRWSSPAISGETAGLKRVGSAYAVADGRESGGAKALLFGGMGADGTILKDLMVFTVRRRDVDCAPSHPLTRWQRRPLDLNPPLATASICSTLYSPPLAHSLESVLTP